MLTVIYFSPRDALALHLKDMEDLEVKLVQVLPTLEQLKKEISTYNDDIADSKEILQR